MTYDSIVIGAGLAGLVAGAKLAREGKKVLVLDQHTIPGGYSTSFTVKNYTIDVGLQSMDGLYERDPKIPIFEDLDVFYNVEFVHIKTGYYRFTNSREDFSLPDKREDAIDVLIRQFPKEEKAIRDFFETIETITTHTHKIPRTKALQAMIGPLVPILYSSIPKWGRRNAGEMLDMFFDNEDLKLVLAGTLLYYSDDPYKLSAIIFALALSSHFKGGNHYIKGGSMKLSGHLANFIRENNGTILLGQKVTKIIVDKGKAVGVEYVSKKDLTATPISVYGSFIIANASAPQVAFKLLSEEDGKKLRDKIKGMTIGHSTTNVYLGFNKSLQELGHSDFATVVNDPSVFTLKDVFSNHYGDYTKRNYMFIDYGQIDSGMAPFGKSTGIISFIDNIESWEDIDDEQYEQKKRDIVEIFVNRLNELIPGAKDFIEYKGIANPRTKMRYTLNPAGTSIGFAQTLSQAGMKRMKSKSPIENLHFASAWTFPGGGFSSTIWAGWQAAAEILNKMKD